jgi:predicted nucleotidyltransferase
MLSLSFEDILVDILLPSIPFFYEVIKFAKKVKLFNKDIKVAKPEDLIILKLLSQRKTDIKDIELLKSAELNLNIKYIEEKLEKLVGIAHPAYAEFTRIFKNEER